MIRKHHCSLGGLALAAKGVAILALASLSASANVSFLGVAAGDASSTEVTLWTRAVDTAAPAASALTLQITKDATFATGVMGFPEDTDANADYTCKLVLQNLQPGTRYYYRFVGPNNELSIAGTFKTAPVSTASAPVHFAFSGDMDGLMRPYALASTIPAQALDFYVNIGDTIYETASNPNGNSSPAVTSTGTIPGPTSTGATQSQLFNDFSKKYREQFLAVNAGGQNCLQSFYASQGNYTLYDNHELGNKQYINGGAPPGGAVGDMTSGAGVDARVYVNDVNSSGAFMNKSLGFQTLERVFLNYQPIKERGLISASGDPRTDGTPQLYSSQQWGRNAIFINTDARSYRDIRMKTQANADDTTAPRANNTLRTYLGATQLAWLEQALLNAESAGTPWKFVTTSDPMDQIGPIGGALSGVVNSSGNVAYAPVSSDGGKSWMGGYRAERNALLKFIADHQIKNVVFLTTDDHQNRINELTYSPSGQTEVQSSYVKVPYCFQIVCGPLGATGPDLFLNHDFNSVKTMVDSFVTAQQAAGIEPFGLQGYPGLHNVVREGDVNAGTSPSAVDFYSPDTFNYNTLDVSADGKTLTVRSIGINSTAQNAALEYDPVNNPARQIFSFQVDAVTPLNNIDHFIVVYQENWSFDALYGSFPGANGLANASAVSLNQLDRLTGNSLSSETGNNTYNNPSKNPNLPNQNPPVPLNGTQDVRFLTNPADVNSPTLIDTLLPYSLTDAPLTLQPSDLTGDIVHRYWTEALQINGGLNNKFITWSDNPGLVMSHFDASNLPEGLLAQQYTMCDNYFHSAFGGSFLNHQFFIAAAPPVYPNAASIIPNNVTTLAADGSLALDGNGKIIRDQNITPIGGQVFNFPLGTMFDQNYAVNTIFSANLQTHTGSPTATTLLPSQNNSNPSDPVRPYIPTIGDVLDNAGISWKWYSGGWNNALDSSSSNPVPPAAPNNNTVDPLFQWHHQAFAFFDRYKPFDATQPNGRNPVSAAHLQDEANFFTDVANGTLPSVVFIKPLGPDNEHPGYASLLQGQNHVASIVAAVQANPALWARTAIIVTYDEHGGRWDHVSPPVRDIWGPGVRVPAIVISPFAKQGFVDHRQRDTSSILATIEQRFGLPSLNQRDASAPSFADVLTDIQVNRGSDVLNRRLNKISEQVTIVNNASVPIAGPINLALDNLSSNTALSNGNGTTANNAPLGSPYITASASDLAPGASTTVTLLFSRPVSGSITYNPRAITGTANP
jgi:acid phosphatase